MAESVLKYPAPELRKKTVPVEKIGEDVFSLVDRMIETMIAEDGVGLAANQVGSSHRIFILNAHPNEEDTESIVCINPTVLQQEGEEICEEGCLSFPELYLKIARPQKVRLSAKNLYNESFVLDLSGILARATMHEMDHLDGVLLIDHAAATDKEMIAKYTEETLGKAET
ncbi:MAG: peptide deformylase [candidate division WOR-3 bacterium]|nr:MAG: peptide deformylase [candidate division WOR-3 bacterium]